MFEFSLSEKQTIRSNLANASGKLSDMLTMATSALSSIKSAADQMATAAAKAGALFDQMKERSAGTDPAAIASAVATALKQPDMTVKITLDGVDITPWVASAPAKQEAGLTAPEQS